jgi:HlyD family secretion protein
MFSKLPRKFIFIGLGLIVLLGGAFAVYRFAFQQETQISDEPTIQTATVRQGDIVLRASGSGTLIPVRETALGFGSSGPLDQLLVQVGDEVTEGEVLAIQGNQINLEAALQAAELDYLSAQQELQEIYDLAASATAQAQLDLAQAQDELRVAEYTRAVQQEGNRASEAMLDSAKADLIMAKKDLERAKAAYDKLSGLPEDNVGRANALQKYASAQAKYDSALRNMNWYTGHPTELQQALLDADVAIAEAKVQESQLNWEKVKDGPHPSALALAQVALTNAEAQYAMAQQNYENATIRAPFDGVITDVTAIEGETVSGSFITIADISYANLDVYLDESDLYLIDIDHEVEVFFDALPDDVFMGHITRVDPSLMSSQNISTIHAIAQLEEGAFDGTRRLPLGSNAAVDVIAGRAEGAILVPFEALRELGPDEYAVFIMEDGEPRLRVVEVGLVDYTSAEILSGLQRGDVVSTGIVETE